MAEPTALDQYLIELINHGRANPSAEASRFGIDLNQGLNAGAIKTDAKQPLAPNLLLTDAAQKHTASMIANNKFSHTGADGSKVGDRIARAGYDIDDDIGETAGGENISAINGTGVVADQAAVDQMYESLFRSAGHRKNTLNQEFREVGVGVVGGTLNEGDGTTTPTVHVTEVFTKAGRDEKFLTGVAFTDAVDHDNFYDVGEGMGGIRVEATSATGETFATDTWAAGGYSLALKPGTYTVVFSGGGLANPVTKTASIIDRNLKVDFDQDTDAPVPAEVPVLAADWLFA